MTVGAALLSTPIPPASAEPCPDVEVIFARGTGEPPGVGGVGQAFVDALRSDAGNKSVAVYPVNYPAASNFDDPIAFAGTVVDGVRDAGGHVQSTATNCPNTRIVLGGYSQGAAVAGYVTSASVPPGVPAALVPGAIADRGRQPRRRGHSLRKAVGRLGDSVRRAADCDRPGICAEDHPVVRSRRHHLQRHTRWRTDVRARAVPGERDGRRRGILRGGSVLAHGNPLNSGFGTSASGSSGGGGTVSDGSGTGAAGGGAAGPGATGAEPGTAVGCASGMC